MPSLSDKLRMMDTGARKPAPEKPPEPLPQACYHVSERFALSSFSALTYMSAPVLRDIYGLSLPKTIKPQDVLFLDAETTGLSGGAGTVAFEIGVGYFSGGQFVVEQFLMRDYPEEPLLLAQIQKLLRAFPMLATFNGRTFDMPLLQSRFLLHRMQGYDEALPHADVLHAARRVWKLRLGRCNLQRLEEAVLGVTREDDLPGSQVPQTYFQYLRNGDFAPLERVLEHNRQDLVSLAQLFFYLCQLHEKPETTGETADLISLAKAAQKRGDTGKAKKCYRLAAHSEHRALAFHALAAQEKREGNPQSAVKLYTAMIARGDEPVAACEALAKLYEHQLGNPGQALAYTRQALLLLSEPTLTESETVQTSRIALQYRYARLRRKLSGDAKS